MAKYLYDPGVGRFKHCWNKPYAGFEPGARGAIGKCANTISREMAQTLLDEGIPYWESPEDTYPRAI